MTEGDAAAKRETAGGVSVVARFEYDAWGNILSATSSVPALARNRYRFQCREWSEATGLVNFRARWYDPVTGSYHRARKLTSPVAADHSRHWKR